MNTLIAAFATLALALSPVVLASSSIAGPAAALVGEGRARVLPPEGGPLEAGRYATAAVGPELDFVVGDSWRLSRPVDGPVVVLERVDIPGGVLTITRFDGDAFADSCDPTSLTWVEPSARRFIEIIAGDPRLAAGEPEAAEVGGLAGFRLDVSTPPLEGCELPFLLIWTLQMEGGEFVQVPGQQARFIALDVGPDVLVLAIESLTEDPFGFFTSEAMEVVDSLRIRARIPGSTATAAPSPGSGRVATPRPSPAG